MAVRMLQLQRRLLSLLVRNQTQPPTTLLKEPSRQFLPSANALFSRLELHKREFQTQTNPTSHADDDLENNEVGCLKPDCDSSNVLSNINASDTSAVKYSAISNLKTSPRHNLAMIFTCNVCETRSVKTASRESYEKGVVVARCGGCNNLHLIADHLGLFGKPGSIEDFLAARGEEVKKGSIDTINLTLEDLAGRKP